MFLRRDPNHPRPDRIIPRQLASAACEPAARLDCERLGERPPCAAPAVNGNGNGLVAVTR
jgi:hypothetical protein